MAVYLKDPTLFESNAERLSRQAREERFAKMSPLDRRAAQLDARERGGPVMAPAAPAPPSQQRLSALEQRALNLMQQDAAKRGRR
jgi:hypothetical protein